MSTRRTSVARRTTLLLAIAGCLPAAVRAASSDDSGGRLVVPLVWQDKETDTTVFLTNHEPRAVKVQVRYVGERSGPNPGLRSCGTLPLAATSRTALNVASLCGLQSPGPGMVVFVHVDGDVVRLSAQARIDTVSSGTTDILGSLTVNGLPLGALDTTENRHVVSGLRQNAPGAPATVTDCFFGGLFDGSGYGGMVGRLDLSDDRGQLLGSRLFTVKPFELVALRDVFALVGAPPGPHTGVRADVVWTGGGDALVGYCVAARAGAKKFDRTLALDLAQVAEPNDELRKREIAVSETPTLGAFALPPPLPFVNPRVTHGLFLRHPDRATCGVASDDPNNPMVITAVSPDGSQTFGGQSSRTPEFGGSPRGAVNAGVADLWALRIEWAPGASAAGGTKYRIDCRSGNGTSLADVVF